MSIFLRMKHWQLFLLFAAIPIILEVIAMATMFSSEYPEANPGIIFILFPLAMAFFIAVFLGWLYTLGINLHHKLPATVTMKLTRFRIFLFYPLVYMLLFCTFFFAIVPSLSDTTEAPPFFVFALIIFPLHFFAVFCMFHSIYFIAKSLKAVELQRPVTFSDYAGEFFLLWFFPIGVWFIQPRINTIFAPQA